MFARGIRQHITKCPTLASRSFITNSSASASTSTLPRQPQLSKKNFITGCVVGLTGYFGYTYYNLQPKNRLDPFKYVPLKLIKKEQISPDSYRLRLATDRQPGEPYPVPSCLYVKDDTIQVMRAYTPINSNPYEDGYIDLVVKRYSNGSVSRTLSGFDLEDRVHVRGPMIEEYEYETNSVDEIGMIAGGTGISPMYQIICRVLENSIDKSHIWLIYGNKTEQDILLKTELDELQQKYSDRFKIKYVLETVSKDKADKYETGYVTKAMIKEMANSGNSGNEEKKRKVFVCGPTRLLELVCGERARDYSQGQVTGILSHLGYTSNEVWKFQ